MKDWNKKSIYGWCKGMGLKMAGLKQSETELQWAEKEIHNESQRFYTLSEYVPSEIVMINKGGSFKYVDPKLKELFGYDLNDIPNGKTWFSKAFSDLTYRCGVFSARIKNLRNLKPGEKRKSTFILTCKDGTKRIVKFTAFGLETDENLMICEDITGRKQQEDVLVEVQETYRSIFENVPVGLYRSTPEGKFIEFNSALLQMLGYSNREVLQTVNFGELYANLEERKRWKDLMEREGVLRDDEVQFVRADGKIIFVKNRARPVYDETQGVLYYEGAIEDITEWKQQEYELEAMITLTNILRTAPTRTQILSIVLDHILDWLKADGGALVMCNLTNNEIMVEWGHRGWSNWFGKRLPLREGVTGHVIETSQSYLNNEMGNNSLFEWHDLVGDLQAGACIPLIAHEQTIGALWIGRKTSIDYRELRIFTAIGDIIASALYHPTSNEQRERHVQPLTTLSNFDIPLHSDFNLFTTFNFVLEQVTTRLQVDAAAILLLNAATSMLEYAAGTGFRSHAIKENRLRLGEGHAGQAAIQQCMVSIPDRLEDHNACDREKLLVKKGFIAYLAMPIISQSQVKGVLEIFHRTSFCPDQERVKFLETLTEQLAIAVDNAELKSAYDMTLEGWARGVSLRDKEPKGHSERVAEMTLKLARAFNITEAELVNIRRGALLHDIGKMGIPDSILLKPGPLTSDEWKIIQRHPLIAYELLSRIPYLCPVLDIPYCHHEKWDGTGYPRGLKGDQIPFSARIFTVVDTYDALRSNRPYRPAWLEKEACDYIQSMADIHFDPKVVKIFFEIEK